ncbi:hypothetical protein [Helicobacter sp.]|uniref:hypothetical protein n=1 Tax=Helicobacter sp. TaxID=218 RepID=UPI00199527B1|nr:hypothetical protein [Helicobacter sp.]MBD5165111.1 hypothetical protein [Helicobacter sp.]
MKKLPLIALTLSPFLVLANPSENILKEQKAIHQQSLDYLFDSKFPLDDYTYRKKPNPNQVIQIKKNNEIKNSESTMDKEEEFRKKEEEFERKITETQKKVETKKRELEQGTPKKKVNLTSQQRMNNLLRDSILAERGSQEIYFSKGAI